MFIGSFALFLRYALTILGSMAVSIGLFSAGGQNGFYCFDAKIVADWMISSVALVLGGGGAVIGSVGWRFWAKTKPGAVT